MSTTNLRLRKGAAVPTLLVAALLAALLLSTFAASPVRGASTVTVGVQNFAFNPGSITVVIGVNNTVAWTNHDSVNHTVTANGGSFDHTLAAGDTFTYTFSTPGTYAYHCTIHGYMTGTVVVLAGTSGTTTSSSSSSSSSSGSTGGIPEFPAQALAVTLVTAIVFVSYLALRRTRGSRAA